MTLTVMEASSSRLIAPAGMVAILFIDVGFGIFSLYTDGLTCQMPASAAAVTTFLYSSLTLFAPYVANKVSGLLQPSCGTPPLPAETVQVLPAENLVSPLPQPLPQLPAVSSAAHAQAALESRVAARATGNTPPHGVAAPALKPSTAIAAPADAGRVGAHHQVELHQPKSEPQRRLQGVLTKAAADTLAAGVFRHHVAGIGHMGTQSE